MATWVSKYYKGGYEALENKRKPGNPYGGYSKKKNLTYVEQLEYDNFTLTVENKALKKGLNPERVWLRAKRK